MNMVSSGWQTLLDWATFLSGIVACLELSRWMHFLYRNRSQMLSRNKALVRFLPKTLSTWLLNTANIVLYSAILLLASVVATMFLLVSLSIFADFGGINLPQQFAGRPRALLGVLIAISIGWFATFSLLETRKASLDKVKIVNLIFIMLLSLGSAIGFVFALGAQVLGYEPNVLGWSLIGAVGALGLAASGFFSKLGSSEI